MRKLFQSSNLWSVLYKTSLLVMYWFPYAVIVSVVLALVCNKTKKDKVVQIIIVIVYFYIVLNSNSDFEAKIIQTFLLACILFLYNPIAAWARSRHENKILKK